MVTRSFIMEINFTSGQVTLLPKRDSTELIYRAGSDVGWQQTWQQKYKIRNLFSKFTFFSHRIYRKR